MALLSLALLWYYITGRLKALRLEPGDSLESDAERVFVVSRGLGYVFRDGPGGHDILLRIVRRGGIVRAGDKLMAETHLDLLALPARLSRRGRADA
jgi:hypothetical protein